MLPMKVVRMLQFEQIVWLLLGLVVLLTLMLVVPKARDGWVWAAEKRRLRREPSIDWSRHHNVNVPAEEDDLRLEVTFEELAEDLLRVQIRNRALQGDLNNTIALLDESRKGTVRQERLKQDYLRRFKRSQDDLERALSRRKGGRK